MILAKGQPSGDPFAAWFMPHWNELMPSLAGNIPAMYATLGLALLIGLALGMRGRH